MNSYRTSIMGILTILVAIGSAALAEIDGKPETRADWTSVIAAITAGAGLLAARDNKVTSEQAGAK